MYNNERYRRTKGKYSRGQIALFHNFQHFKEKQNSMMVFTRSSSLAAKASKSSRGASKPKISRTKTTKTTKVESKASPKSRDVLKLYVKLDAPAEVLLVTLPLESTVDDLCARILELYAEHFDDRPALPTPFDVRNHTNALVSRSEQIIDVFEPEEIISVTARTSSSQRSLQAAVDSSPVCATEPTSRISTDTLHSLGPASPSTGSSSATAASSNSSHLEESSSATRRSDSDPAVRAHPRNKCDSWIWDKTSEISSLDAFHVSYEDNEGAVILIEEEKWSWETLIVTYFPREQSDPAGMPIFSNVPLSKGVHFLVFEYSGAFVHCLTCGILNQEGVKFSQSYPRSSSCEYFPMGIIPDGITPATALGVWHGRVSNIGSIGFLVNTNRGKFYGCKLQSDSWIVVETMNFPSTDQYFPFMWCYAKPGGPVSVKHTLVIPSELQSL